METSIRQQAINLTPIAQTAHRYHFMQLLRLLEHANVLQNYRLLPYQHLSFPATDVLYCNETEMKITLRFMGLFGVDSPLPSYFLSETLQSLGEGAALRTFLNIFNHQIYQLFYKAWKRAQPAILYEQGNNKYLHFLVALSGGSLSINDKRELTAVGIMGQRIHSANGLQLIIQKFLSLNVTIQQFIQRWVSIQADYSLGKNFCLGESMLGKRVLDLSSRVLITIGTMSLSKALSLLPNQIEGKRLTSLIKRYVEPHISYQLCLKVEPETTSILSLGASSYYLGYQSWIGELPSHKIIYIFC